jgi:hypothetical protein
LQTNGRCMHTYLDCEYDEISKQLRNCVEKKCHQLLVSTIFFQVLLNIIDFHKRWPITSAWKESIHFHHQMWQRILRRILFILESFGRWD